MEIVQTMMLIKEFYSNLGGIASWFLFRINTTGNVVSYAKDINGDDKQELHDAMQRYVNYKKVSS
jgi:hypothetical protein